MAYSQAANRAAQKYRAEHIKRIPLEVQNEGYEIIKAAADAAGQKVNAYIKQAIRMRMEADAKEAEENTKESPV